MAHEVKILTEADLREVVQIDKTAIDVVEQAFVALASGSVIMPPIMSMDLAEMNADVDVKTAYIPGFDGFAIKVSPGFFDNPKIGLPSLNGLMILFSSKTGLVEALLMDNGYLTDVRTAAAGAVAARHLAPKNVDVAGVIGTGLQARLQIIAAHQERSFNKVLVWGRNANHARDCANDLCAELGIDVAVAPSAEALVKDSQLVVTTTPSRIPIISADWLHPGLHITAMGSDTEGKQEIDPKALIEAEVYVCDRVSQCEVSGELEGALKMGIWKGQPPAELGDVIVGARSGRQSDNDITICDLTGTGAQDTAIATHALKVSGNRGSMIQT